MIDRIVVDIFSPRLEGDYLRFDESTYYFHNKTNDCYIRVFDYEQIEAMFKKEKENDK